MITSKELILGGLGASPPLALSQREKALECLPHLAKNTLISNPDRRRSKKKASESDREQIGSD